MAWQVSSQPWSCWAFLKEEHSSAEQVLGARIQEPDAQPKVSIEEIMETTSKICSWSLWHDARRYSIIKACPFSSFYNWVWQSAWLLQDLAAASQRNIALTEVYLDSILSFELRRHLPPNRPFLFLLLVFLWQQVFSWSKGKAIMGLLRWCYTTLNLLASEGSPVRRIWLELVHERLCSSTRNAFPSERPLRLWACRQIWSCAFIYKL